MATTKTASGAVPVPTAGSRWTDAFLDHQRLIMDPPADDAVRGVIADQGISSVNDLLRSLVHNDRIVPADMPPRVRDYLEATSLLPTWIDPDQVHLGESLFGLYGIPIVMALFCASLPASYAAASGVQVLYLTAQLRTSARRRIIETAQMVVDVMAPGGLAPGGLAVRDCQKVRLMHAGVRQWVLASGKWNPEWGLPINQEDLAGTLCTFTTAVFQALDRLDIKLSAEQQEAYFHCWRVVAHLLGVQPGMLPDNVADAWDLTNTIQRRHFRASEAGHAMTAALVEMMQEATPRALKGLPHTIIRHCLGDEIGDLLGLPPADWTERVATRITGVLSASGRRKTRSRLYAGIMQRFDRRLIGRLVWVARGGDRPSFHIPEALQDTWKYKPSLADIGA